MLLKRAILGRLREGQARSGRQANEGGGCPPSMDARHSSTRWSATAWGGRALALASNASIPAEGYWVDDAAEHDGYVGACTGLELGKGVRWRGGEKRDTDG